MLDTDQHLVGARCRRFKKVGKLERREVRPARPVSWVLRFTPDRSYTLRFDGARWSRQRGEAQADLVIQTSPEGWVRFLSADRAGRERWLDRSRVTGTSKSAKELLPRSTALSTSNRIADLNYVSSNPCWERRGANARP